MGRFLAIVLALVAIALLVNWYQSKDEPTETEGPALVAPDKADGETVPLIKDVPEPTTTSPAEIAQETEAEEAVEVAP
jgi:hypothetical protein